jgi:phosphoglycerate dehydrogenase-like enzyme
MKVLVPRTRFVRELSAFALVEPVVVRMGEPAPPQAQGARAIVSEANHWQALRPYFDAVATLETIFMTSAGYDHVAQRYEGVSIVNARGAHGGSTAEMAIAMILAHTKKFVAFEAAKRQHNWVYGVSGSMQGARILVLGAGDLGRRIARIATAMEADPVLFARTARGDVHALSEVGAWLAGAYAVVIALPMSAELRRLADAAFLAAIPDGGILVNVGRGGIVDTDALVRELATGRIAAGIDVTDPEPLPANHPLWDAPNLILTPHVGGFARGSFGRIIQVMGAGMEAMARGETPDNLIPLAALPPPTPRPTTGSKTGPEARRDATAIG